jgi:hypothetical protein
LLGAVGAGARVGGLSGEQASLALRIGAILVLTPGYTNAVAGATALNVAGGMSGFAGTLAPELALAGVAAGRWPTRRERGRHRDHTRARPSCRSGLRRPYVRSDLKPARISSEKSFGCSQAAKCPPLSSLL